MYKVSCYRFAFIFDESFNRLNNVLKKIFGKPLNARRLIIVLSTNKNCFKSIFPKMFFHLKNPANIKKISVVFGLKNNKQRVGVDDGSKIESFFGLSLMFFVWKFSSSLKSFWHVFFISWRISVNNFYGFYVIVLFECVVICLSSFHLTAHE